MSETSLLKIPFDKMAIDVLEKAIEASPHKTVRLKIDSCLYLLSREGQWYKFSQLTKKHTIKRSTIFATLSDLYDYIVSSLSLPIADCSIV